MPRLLPSPGQEIVAKLTTWPNIKTDLYENFKKLYVAGSIVQVDFETRKFVCKFPSRLEVHELDFSYLERSDVIHENSPDDLEFLSMQKVFEKEGHTARSRAMASFDSHVILVMSGCVVEGTPSL